jgi:NADP-dependent aldehyde dehydrogenase
MTITQTSTETLSEIMASSSLAAGVWAAEATATRAAALDAIAGALDSAEEELVLIARRETHLADSRLRSELKRTTFQLRLFAEILIEGSFLDARIDHADPEWPMGVPRPDLRRVLEPLGPVVVFAASNFPFAFSVAGGDTASALAAGCSVVVKAHSGHPELSAVTARIITETLTAVHAPAGLFAIIFGIDSGRAALTDPRVKAGSFTGSISAGRALYDLANSRPEPIPFFAEMGSVNPTFVTRAADAARGREIAEGFMNSVILGAGQFCTKPGVILVPENSETLRQLRSLPLAAPAKLLNERIQAGYAESLRGLLSHPAVEILSSGGDPYADPPLPTILCTTAEDVLQDPTALLVECFGPASLVVTYADESSMRAVAGILDGQLTATIQAETAEDEIHELVRLLARRAGRLLWNQWPTGVSVSYAQQHGGPYPATTSSGSTSVGTAAIFRFLRPVAYQGFPQALLPEAVRDGNSLGIPQRIDGHIVMS